MKVAIVHDDLVQLGGAERVLEGLCEIFPDATIYTSLFDGDNESLQRLFGSRKIRTSFLQKIPFWKFLYKSLLPLYPIAFEQFNFDSFDLVISHTTRFAKSIITKPQTKHICYCHTPPRFLWHLTSGNSHKIISFLLSGLRIIDRISAKRVDFFIAGSKNAQKRIKKIYREESTVVYPFIDLERFKGVESFDGGYFVVISRLVKYKRVDLIVEAFTQTKKNLKIIGSGSEFENLKSMAQGYANIEFLGNLSDELTAKVLAGAKALIVASDEDFGLTLLEAQALGKPVLAYKSGGALESVIHLPAGRQGGKTGAFFKKQDANCIKEVVTAFDLLNIDSDKCRANAYRFSKDKFKENFLVALKFAFLKNST